MAMRRTAITVPQEVLSAIDRAARARGESRSGFISRVLRQAVRSRRDAAITRRLDELFADAAVAEDQRRRASDLDRVGTDWSDETW